MFAWNVLKVALGLGFVIFLHELGHFLLAKWNGVKVETFSIGFGPTLASFRRGAGIRIGPHFYTSDDEIERAVDMIDGILRDESWKPFEERRGTVT